VVTDTLLKVREIAAHAKVVAGSGSGIADGEVVIRMGEKPKEVGPCCPSDHAADRQYGYGSCSSGTSEGSLKPDYCVQQNAVVQRAGGPKDLGHTWQREDCATTADEECSTSDVDEADEDVGENEPGINLEQDTVAREAMLEVCGDAAGVSSLQLDQENSAPLSCMHPVDMKLERRLETQLERLGNARLIAAWAKVLEQLAVLRSSTQRTVFCASRAPQISIFDYLRRISHYTGCSDACITLGLVYIDRIMKMHSEFIVSAMNVHRLLATSVVVAAKYHDDVFYSNGHYARVAGVKVEELSLLEEKFLLMIDWRLYVDPLEYEQYLYQGVMTVAGQGPARKK
jgi:hypothetical protein